MADSFGGGLASGLNGLLGSLRNDRERKAQEQFKLKLISEDNATNQQIAERTRKQQALQMFGAGLSKIQEQQVQNDLAQLQGNVIKHARTKSKPLESYAKELNQAKDDYGRLSEKLASYLDKADAKDGENLNNLLEKDPAKKADFTNTRALLGKTEQKIASLNALLEGGLVEQQKLEGDVSGRAEQLKQYNIDDVLNTREAKVLQLSLGLTDDDVQQFRVGGKPSGIDRNAIINKPFDGGLGQQQAPQKLSDLAQKAPEYNTLQKEELTNKLKSGNLDSLSADDVTVALNTNGLNSLLKDANDKYKSRIEVLRNKIAKGVATPKDLEEFKAETDNINSMTPEEFSALREGNPTTGRSLKAISGIGLLSNEVRGGLSTLLEKKNIRDAGATTFAQDVGNSVLGDIHKANPLYVGYQIGKKELQIGGKIKDYLFPPDQKAIDAQKINSDPLTSIKNLDSIYKKFKGVPVNFSQNNIRDSFAPQPPTPQSLSDYAQPAQPRTMQQIYGVGGGNISDMPMPYYNQR